MSKYFDSILERLADDKGTYALSKSKGVPVYVITNRYSGKTLFTGTYAQVMTFLDGYEQGYKRGYYQASVDIPKPSTI